MKNSTTLFHFSKISARERSTLCTIQSSSSSTAAADDWLCGESISPKPAQANKRRATTVYLYIVRHTTITKLGTRWIIIIIKNRARLGHLLKENSHPRFVDCQHRRHEVNLRARVSSCCVLWPFILLQEIHTQLPHDIIIHSYTQQPLLLLLRYSTNYLYRYQQCCLKSERKRNYYCKC